MSCLNLEERMELLPGVNPRRIVHEMQWSLGSELVATERRTDRLRAWAKAGCPVAELGDVRVSEAGNGAREQIIAALGRIPPPVLHFVAQKCAILGLGVGVGGTTCNGTDFGGRILLVVTAGSGDPEEVQTLTAHEVAHSWLHGSDELREVESMGEHERRTQALECLADEWVGPGTMRSRMESATERIELEATALCRAWGFRGTAAYHHRKGRTR